MTDNADTACCLLPAALSSLPAGPATVHFIGIGGIAMSGLARVLLARGYRVSGCDMIPNRLTGELAACGATICTGHDPAHLDGVDLVVISAAIRPGHRELDAAVARGITIVTAADVLGLLLQGLRTVAVAGTHGKTTTSSLVAAILLDVGYDPTAFIGGEVPALGGNVRGGHGAWAVAEADEYDRRFLRLTPEVAVVTNVEADHLDIYGDLAAVRHAFAAFVARIPAGGLLVACADDPNVAAIAEAAPCRVVTYGLDRAAGWRAHDITFNAEGTRFTVEGPDIDGLTVATRLSGRHNVANVLAALAACAAVGVAPADAIATLARFELPRRRQEVKGHAAGGAIIVDDYAHHHTEIRATLAGLRARYPGRRLRVAFQPHTYTRTKAFLHETGASFGAADEVAIAEVYAARETDTLGVGGRDVVAAARSAGARATFTPTLDDVASWLASDDGPDVVLVTMGAGDIWKSGEQIADRGQRAAGR